jgi:beta-lactam-binding protein with PASTA domain
MRWDRPSWLTVAVAGAAGFLAGVLLVAVLGRPKGTVHTTTRVVPQTETQTLTIDPRPKVPDVVGKRLPDARQELEDAGFDVDVQDDTVFGIIDESHFVVVEQDPPAGERLADGDTVAVRVERQ